MKKNKVEFLIDYKKLVSFHNDYQYSLRTMGIVMEATVDFNSSMLIRVKMSTKEVLSPERRKVFWSLVNELTCMYNATVA